MALKLENLELEDKISTKKIAPSMNIFLDRVFFFSKIKPLRKSFSLQLHLAPVAPRLMVSFPVHNRRLEHCYLQISGSWVALKLFYWEKIQKTVRYYLPMKVHSTYNKMNTPPLINSKIYNFLTISKTRFKEANEGAFIRGSYRSSLQPEQ